jgi:hypothetical protein
MTEELPILKEETIEIEGGHPIIQWIRVRDAVGMLWIDNPKIHDIPSVIRSIHTYGFQELPVFDINLVSVRNMDGAIKAGNGRIEALDAMERQGYDVPRNIGVETATDYWAMPVVFGTDAISRALAEAYAVDSNNLVVAGMEDANDVMRGLWGDGYVEIINRLLAEDIIPISIDDSALEDLVSGMSDIGDVDLDEFEDVDTPEVLYKVIVDGLDLEHAESLSERIDSFEDVSGARVEQYRV